jgi:hypothetical protein
MALKRWAIPNFVVDTDTELHEAQANEETMIFSMLLSNYGTEEATIEVMHTDGFEILFRWKITKTSAESPTAIDSVIVLAPGDKILVRSNKSLVAVIASGDVK